MSRPIPEVQALRGFDVREVVRPASDRLWAVLFGCSLLAQVFLASVSLVVGPSLATQEGDEVFLPPTSQLETSLRTASAGLMACAIAGVCFLLLLTWIPVRLVIYGVTLCCPGALVALGGLLLFLDDEVAALGPSGGSAGGPVLIAFGVLGLLGARVFWRHIRLGVAVLRCTSAFLRDVPCVGLYPPCFALAHITGAALWLLALLGAALFLGEGSIGFSAGFWTRVAVSVGLLLAFLWGNASMTALSTFAVARVAAGWYYSAAAARGSAEEPETEPEAAADTKMDQVYPVGGWRRRPRCGLGNAVVEGVVQRLGSLAFGALLLAIVRLIHLLLGWLAKKDAQISSGPAYQVQTPSLARSCREFATNVSEVAATWASRQAFVQLALNDGSCFAQAAERAARLALNAPAGFAAVESLAYIFHRTCELALVAVAVLAARVCGAQGAWGLLPPAIAACLAAEGLLHPYSVATSTILQCYLLEKPIRARPAQPSVGALDQTLDAWFQADSSDSAGHSFVRHYQV